ncbi:MAG: N-acetyl sugar amidotransferase [Gemmatimonadota bacterium]
MLTSRTYCARCVYPVHAVNIDVDDDGICSSCRAFERAESLTPEFWDRKRALFERIIEQSRSAGANYDCIIPVSGGKDSYYQTDIIVKRYGLKPLLVTYHGNNYLPEGDYNRDRMRHVFDADHLVFGPSVEVLKKLNRICFRKMGDMNWHAHCGIFTYPIQMSVKLGIPLHIWGETSWDISGMFDPDDLVEFSARVRHEHDLRGFEWYDMLGDAADPLAERDLLWARYPSDEDILRVGSRGIYIGNFFKWDPYAHTAEMMKRHGWKEAAQPFERTYRTISNLDDRYENGIHDLMKFVKFGYGRGSDHASKDIRTGYLTREQGVEMVRRYDHVVSSDLPYWLEYVGMSEGEFWSIADSFRDPRVWWIEEGQWIKHNVWGTPSAYGPVHLRKDEWKRFTAPSLAGPANT